MGRIADASPRLTARIAGVFYLLTFVTGLTALFVRGRVGFVSGLVAGACYIAVTLLLYRLLTPVNRSLSLAAALISLIGVAAGPLRWSVPNPLVYFGIYCLMLGYLIFKSTFLPRFLGLLVAFAGVGWLTFLSPPLARNLSPYNFAPGIIGEGVLTVWLLAVGVNPSRWRERAIAARASAAQHKGPLV